MPTPRFGGDSAERRSDTPSSPDLTAAPIEVGKLPVRVSPPSFETMRGLEINLVVPDLWQQEAVRALQAGQDVVVHAPTGAGKTYIFELLYPSLKGQAVFTVPTRALANDKLAEWRARGWDVGIATGDLALNLDAKVVVATLETQRARFLRREGPRLLVVDEYQLIADPVRGVHYELSLALAPPTTQLLLLSGSVNNPQDVVDWLRRNGRDAVLVRHEQRPVPQHEVDLRNLPEVGFIQTREFWPRMIAKALHAGLAPILVFAPRRNATEDLAQAIASAIPARDPLPLSPAQEALAGKRLTKLLRSRVAYHHSGLSYAVRAGLIEPLAKSGQLNVVVATMGLAAGINFSMRSVLITDTRYLSGNFERHVQPDELLQMFGRAGRRGLDDTGFVLFTPDQPRLSFARPRQLKRATQVDWPSLISVMRGAAERGEQPLVAAVDLTRSLFSVQKVPLGVEHSLLTGAKPCGLWVDAERARFVRRAIVEMWNSREEWEPRGPTVQTTLGQLFVRAKERWVPALSLPASLDRFPFGNLCRLAEKRIYGREMPLATTGPNDPEVLLVKPLRKLAGAKTMPETQLIALARERLPQWSGGGEFCELVRRGSDFVRPDRFLRRPGHGRERFVRPDLARSARAAGAAARLPRLPGAGARPDDRDRGLPGLRLAATRAGRAGWKTNAARNHLRLFSRRRRSRHRGCAGGRKLSDRRSGFRSGEHSRGPAFCGEDSPLAGRLGALCQTVYERADHPGYLEMGVPIHYGAGASGVIREVMTNPSGRYKITSETFRHGDVERALMEWRSLLRHTAAAPDLDWARWRELKEAAGRLLEQTKPATTFDFPPLLAAQQKRFA